MDLSSHRTHYVIPRNSLYFNWEIWCH